LTHPNINRAFDFGRNGAFKRTDGKVIGGLTYIMLDYVPNGALIEICQNAGKMGEVGGRFYF